MAYCVPHRGQSQPSLLSPKHRESRTGAREGPSAHRMNLVKLMCDFPSVWGGMRIFSLR